MKIKLILISMLLLATCTAAEWNSTGNVLILHMNNDSAYGENDTKAYDFSGNGNNGTILNGAVYTTGKYVNALSFDGFNDYVNAGNGSSLNFASEFTIEVWVKSLGNNATLPQGIIAKANLAGTEYGWILDKGTDNKFYFRTGNRPRLDTLTRSDAAYNDSSWHHIVAVNTGATNYLYVDGVQQTEKRTLAVITPVPTKSLVIGTIYSDAPTDTTYSRRFNGSIDEVRIYNRSLTATEILEHSSTPPPLECNSCDDCELKLNDLTYNDIRLTNTITNHIGTTSTCTGYLANDRDGVERCWFTSAIEFQSCDTICTNAGSTCVQENWNDYDDCRIGYYFYPAAVSCINNSMNTYAPDYRYISTFKLYARSTLTNQVCSSASTNHRICACNYTPGETGTCINNPANFNNKTFNCLGHTIDGNDSGTDYGVYINMKKNNTIKNCKITDFYIGIYSTFSSNNSLTNNTANSNTGYGIVLAASDNNTLTNNTANSNGDTGIMLDSSENNTLTGNTANNNTYGIFDDADNNNFTSNTVKFNNQHGFYAPATSTGNTINTNTFCSNNQSGGDYYDIYVLGSNTGDNNTCATPYGWNDTGTTGCTYNCSIYDYVGTCAGYTAVCDSTKTKYVLYFTDVEKCCVDYLQPLQDQVRSGSGTMELNGTCSSNNNGLTMQGHDCSGYPLWFILVFMVLGFPALRFIYQKYKRK